MLFIESIFRWFKADIIIVVKVLFQVDFFFVFIQYFYIQAQRLQFFNQHFKGFRNTRFWNVLTFYDSFICFYTTHNVVGFYSQNLLQGIRCTVSFQCPNFHLTKTLSAELCFTAQRLLCNKRIWTGRTCVNLIINQVMQF